MCKGVDVFPALPLLTTLSAQFPLHLSPPLPYQMQYLVSVTVLKACSYIWWYQCFIAHHPCECVWVFICVHSCFCLCISYMQMRTLHINMQNIDYLGAERAKSVSCCGSLLKKGSCSWFGGVCMYIELGYLLVVHFNLLAVSAPKWWYTRVQ